MKTFTLNDVPPPHTSALLKAKGVERGVSVEWEVERSHDLTPGEVFALKRKHKSENPNLARAGEVKRLMQEGLACREIVMRLRGKHGATMVKLDHATLSVGEGKFTFKNSSMNR